MNLPFEDLSHVLRNVDGWEKLRGRRIFLTGASGFVGSWIRETFQHANEALDLRGQLVAAPRNCLPFGAFDFGIHAAKAETFWDDMVCTKRSLDFAIERGAKRFLFTSSGAVYGKLPAGMTHVGEEFSGAPYPQEAESGYAQAKRAGEYLCAEYRKRFGLDTVVARMFTFSGPRVPIDKNFAVGNFIRDVLASGPVIVRGDGTAQRSYQYAADLAVWLWTLILEGEGGRVYNVGSPEPISILNLAEVVVRHTRPATQILVMGGEASSVYVPSVERAQSELKLRNLISLDEGIRRMYEWNLNLKERETFRAETTKP